MGAKSADSDANTIAVTNGNEYAVANVDTNGNEYTDTNGDTNSYKFADAYTDRNA